MLKKLLKLKMLRILIVSFIIGTLVLPALPTFTISLPTVTIPGIDFSVVSFDNLTHSVKLPSIDWREYKLDWASVFGTRKVEAHSPLYWYGGSGNWSSGGSHWSTNSGNVPDSTHSSPAYTDSVIFDANSGAAGFTVTVDSTADCNDFDATAIDDALNFTVNSTLNIYGSFTGDSLMTKSGSGTVVFKSVAAGKTITTAMTNSWGSSPVFFDGAGGGWTLQDAFTNTGTSYIRLTNGTLDTNGQTVTTGRFESTSGTQTLTLGASAINLTDTSAGTSWEANEINTLNADTSSITASRNFSGNGFTYNDVILTCNTSTSQVVIGTNTYANLTVNNTTGNKNSYLTLDHNQTVTGTFTAAGVSASNRCMVSTSNGAFQRTITAAAVVSSHTDYYNIIGAGAGDWDISSAGEDSIDFSGCSGITFTYPYATITTITYYWTGLADGVAGEGAWGAWNINPGWDGCYNWSNTSGGVGGVARLPYPISTNDVIFDAGSGFTAGNDHVHPDVNYGGSTCKDLDFTGSGAAVAPYLTFGWNAQLNVYGSLTFISGMYITGGSGGTAINFKGSGNITWASVLMYSYGADIVLNSTGTYTLQDALYIGAPSHSGAGFTYVAGTLDTNGKNIIATVTNGFTFAGGGKTYYGLLISGNSAGNYCVITGANTFTNLTKTCANVFTDSLKFGADQVVTGTLTLTGYDSSHRLQFGSSVDGTQHQITVNGSCVVTNTDIKDSACVGAADPDISAGNNSDMGNNLGWIFTTGYYMYWVGNTGNWSDITHWATSSGGTGGVGSRVPLIQDIAVFDANSFTIPNRVVTIDVTNLSGIDASAVDDASTSITKAGTVDIYGGLNIGINVIYTVTTTNFKGKWNGYLEGGSSSNYIQSTIHILKDASIMASISLSGNAYTWAVYLDSGILDLSSYTLTCSSFDSTTTTYVRAFNMGSGTIKLDAGGAITKWGVNATNLSLYPGTSTIRVSNPGASNQTFTGANQTYYNFVYEGAGSGTLTFTGNNVFNDFTVDRSVAEKTLRFTDGTTTTVSGLYIPVAGVTKVYMRNTSSNNIWTMSDASGTNATDYLDLQYSVVAGGAIWYAGTHSTILDGTVTNNGGVITGSPVGLYEGAPNIPTVSTVGNFTVLMGSSTLTGTATSGPDVTVTGSPKALPAGSTAMGTGGVAPGTINITVTGSGWLLASPTAPTLTTIAASDITQTSVTLNGSVDNLGGYSVIYCYFWYSTDPTFATYSTTAPMSTMSGLGSFSAPVIGLTPETVYYYYAVASSGLYDLAIGSPLYFTTSGSPTVATLAATDLSYYGATLQGQITSMGLYSTLYLRFEYGIDTSYGATTSWQTFTSLSAASAMVSNLMADTTYHFRVEALYGPAVYIYGNDLTLTTLEGSGSAVDQSVNRDKDVLPAVTISNWYQDPDVSGTLMTNPFRPLVTMVSDTTTLNEIQVWRLYALIMVLFITIVCARAVPNHLFIAGVGAGGTIGAAVALTVFPMWALVFTIGCILGGMVAERTSQL
jgi:hypothetical protein